MIAHQKLMSAPMLIKSVAYCGQAAGVQVALECDFGEMLVTLAAWAAIMSLWHGLHLLIRRCQIHPATHTHTPTGRNKQFRKRNTLARAGF